MGKGKGVVLVCVSARALVCVCVCSVCVCIHLLWTINRFELINLIMPKDNYSYINVLLNTIINSTIRCYIYMSDLSRMKFTSRNILLKY